MIDIERWLDDTQELANRLIEMEGAHHRAWGRHLLSDLRSLRLVADKLSEVFEREDEDVKVVAAELEQAKRWWNGG